MAITRWNPFGQQGPAVQDTPAVQVVPIPCADGKRFGLENFGNTCYANSVLQALYFCGPFRDLVIHHADFHNLRSLTSQLSSPPPPPAPQQQPPSATTPRHKPQRRGTIDSIPPHSAAQPGYDPSTATAAVSPPTPPIPSSPRTLFSALRSLYIHISQNAADKGTVAPRAFIDKLKELNEAFRNTMHQDAHEFLNYLLNRIVEEIEEEKKNLHANGNGADDGSTSSAANPKSDLFASSLTGSTFIHQIFEGILTSETRCLTCEKVSARDESFLDLSIDIEANSSVTACLRQFSASEMLCQRNKFFCDGCCDYQEAEKRMKIKRLPNVLALHLKRFKYQEEVQKYIKLAYRVAFPFELRLFNTVDDAENPDRMYELFAIVVHIGSGPNHGHYVSIIKTMGTWLIFDDETVDTIKESDIPKYFGESNAGSAYVLYYQAVDLDLAAIGLQPEPTPQAAEAGMHDASVSGHSPLSTPHINLAAPPGLARSESGANGRVNGNAEQPLQALSPPPDAPVVAPQTGDADKAPRRTISGILGITTPTLGGLNVSPTKPAPVRRPSTATGAVWTKDRQEGQSPVLPHSAGEALPSAALPAPAVNGKEKEGKERTGPWYRRKKSLKSLGGRPASEAADRPPPLPIDHLTSPASPAAVRLATASAHAPGFSAVDLGSAGGDESKASGSVAALATLEPRRRTANRMEERQTSSTGSHTTSSSSRPSHEAGAPVPPPLPLGSAASMDGSDHGANGVASPRALPTIPATPPSTTPPSSITGHSASAGSRTRDAPSPPPSSFPHIPSPGERTSAERSSMDHKTASSRRAPLPFGPSPEAKRGSPSPVRSSGRPSTAGATIGGAGAGAVDRARSLRVLPPLPSAPAQTNGPMRSATFQAATHARDAEKVHAGRGSVNLNAGVIHGRERGHSPSQSQSQSQSRRHGHEYEHEHAHDARQDPRGAPGHHRVPAPPPPSGDIGSFPLAPNRPSSAHASVAAGNKGASLGRGFSIGVGGALGVGSHYGLGGGGGASIGASPGANVSTSTTNTFASNSNSHAHSTATSAGASAGGGGGSVKRAGRKLSLTAPFSFGRKK